MGEGVKGGLRDRVRRSFSFSFERGGGGECQQKPFYLEPEKIPSETGAPQGWAAYFRFR